jgi:hypothetical protein
MTNDVARSKIRLLTQIISQGYSSKAWHGPNLEQSLRGVSAKNAAWRPARGRHNIWEIALHAAYWKYVVRRKLRGDKRGSFALKGWNWFTRPVEGNANDKAWREDLAVLEQEHQKLLDAVAGIGAGKTLKIPSHFIFGVALHDVYHAGQIRLLRRLHAGAER